MSIFLLLILISALMTGVIWIIQLIHYPAFLYVDSEKWLGFHQMHVNGITPLVAPLMVGELGLSIYWVYINLTALPIIHLAMVLALWGSTFLIQVPIHNQIEKRNDRDLIEKLIRTNWIRTLLWTVKTTILMIGYTLI